MQKPKVQIKAYSFHPISNKECITYLIENFPYRLIQEPATHRLITQSSTYTPLITDINPFTKDISRNSASTRAVPVDKIIKKIIDDPYIPTFTRNKKGMQGIDDLDEDVVRELTDTYLESMYDSIKHAKKLSKLGAHKQEINGLLSPYLKIPILATATNWNNFFNLRLHESTHPDFRACALKMNQLREEAEGDILYIDGWHLPFYDKSLIDYKLSDILKICSARNARLSYFNFNGDNDSEDDLRLYNDLLSDPLHGSPFEHNLQANFNVKNYSNFSGGWMSQRYMLENNIIL